MLPGENTERFYNLGLQGQVCQTGDFGVHMVVLGPLQTCLMSCENAGHAIFYDIALRYFN